MASVRASDNHPRRQPLWATALTAGLLAIGFHRRSDAGRQRTSKRKGAERGWREVLKILYGNVSEHRVTAIAGGVAFFALLAIFPFIASIVAIYGLFGDVSALSSHLDQLSSVLPG